MKTLHTVTALIEAGAGLALGCFPSAMVTLLLGSPLDTPAAVVLGRLTGAALLALGVACWLARDDAQSRAARGLVAAMVVYNLGAVALFAFAASVSDCTASPCGRPWSCMRQWPSGASRVF